MNTFISFFLRLMSPGEEFHSITPSDTVDLPNGPARGLILGTEGAVRIRDMKGNDRTLPPLAPGCIHPIRAARVYATGTTATNICGVY